MRRVAAIALALGACKDRPRPEAVPVAPPPDARPLSELPASHRASIAMSGRDRWPCAFGVHESQGIQAQGRSVYSFGKRTACHLPWSLVAQGVWGCPESFQRTDTDGMVRDRRFEYDARGHLLVFEGHTTTRFTWDGDRLVSTTREQFGQQDVATYVDRGDEVVGVDKSGKPQEVLAFSGGQLARIDEYVYGTLGASATIEWRDGRPASVSVDVKGPVAGSVHRDYQYDCADGK